MYQQKINVRFGGPVTPIVKKLMIINGSIFLIQKFFGMFSPGTIELLFGLHYVGFIHEFKLWQPITYMFLHGGWLHIIFNLIALWMFAGELEQKWGSRLFLRYYLYSGIGAGLFIAVMNYIIFVRFGSSPVTIGASGAIYALLLAYGMTWPNREVLLYFLIPVKIKYLVIGFGLLEFFGTISSASGAGGNISHVGHLGGLISGFLILMYRSRTSRSDTRTKATPTMFTESARKTRIKKKKREIETRIRAKKIIDELLEKIARNGMSSLSPEEKRNLEWARKHYYPEDNDTVH